MPGSALESMRSLPDATFAKQRPTTWLMMSDLDSLEPLVSSSPHHSVCPLRPTFMSAPPSPHIGHGSQRSLRKDRPAALDLPQDSERLAVSDGEIQHYRRRNAQQDPAPALPERVRFSRPRQPGAPPLTVRL